MRLRSSQFVFLFLLLCSVQWAEAPTHVWAEVVAGSTRDAASRSVAATRQGQRRAVRSDEPRVSAGGMQPADPVAEAFVRVVRTVRHPAREAAAVASHTGLLRA